MYQWINHKQKSQEVHSENSTPSNQLKLFGKITQHTKIFM